jgi:carbonic anhydrase
MDRLLEGYRRFRAKIWPEARKRYEKLATGGQRPETLVIACSDSRVDPATVFNAGPGELFTLRNVAGLVPPYQPDGGYHGASAAVEFAVRVLKVSRIVIMGHARCGGVQAMMEGAPLEARDFVAPWMSMAESVRSEVDPARSRDENLRRCEAGVVRLSAANLMTFPWIREAVEAGALTIQTYLFAIDDGVLLEVLPEGTRPAV